MLQLFMLFFYFYVLWFVFVLLLLPCNVVSFTTKTATTIPTSISILKRLVHYDCHEYSYYTEAQQRQRRRCTSQSRLLLVQLFVQQKQQQEITSSSCSYNDNETSRSSCSSTGTIMNTNNNEMTAIITTTKHIHEHHHHHHQEQQHRRHFIQRFVLPLSTVTTIPFLSVQPCYGGEIGRRLTEAITTSELGVSVRRSIVRGAQIMDTIDYQTEQFSDKYQLGYERNQQSKRPLPKKIPPLQVLNSNIANQIIILLDTIYCTSIPQISNVVLQEQINTVTQLVLPSFLRSGAIINTVPLQNSTTTTTTITTASQFNFLMYVHYKSYNDCWIRLQQQQRNSQYNNKDFLVSFQKKYEQQVGKELLQLLLPNFNVNINNNNIDTDTAISSNDQERALYTALQQIHHLGMVLVSHGLIAQMDCSPSITDDIDYRMDVTDWSQRVGSDISFTIAIDMDITLSSQILLQEQGIKYFYPNYIRCMITYLLQYYIGIPYHQRITTDDYYLDTDYNSDPNKFEVKEVLINVNIENII